MTTVRTVTLSCDHDEGCESTLTIPFHNTNKVHQHIVRTRARTASWTRNDNKDFCPTHTPGRPPTRYAECPRAGCGRTVQVLPDGSLRRHRLIIGRDSSGLRLGKSCRDPITDNVHTRFPHLMLKKEVDRASTS